MWRTLDHTADVQIEVEAAGWPELLAEAARAFGEFTGGVPLDGPPDGALHETDRALDVAGADRVETWVRFWRELLRLWTVEGFLPLHARVEASPDGTRASAHVGCASAGALDPAHCADVKAVTWHAARVTEDAGRWTGTIVLDL